MSSANQPVLQSSNSTAHIFLGGARPTWMNASPPVAVPVPVASPSLNVFRTRPHPNPLPHPQPRPRPRPLGLSIPPPSARSLPPPPSQSQPLLPTPPPPPPALPTTIPPFAADYPTSSRQLQPWPGPLRNVVAAPVPSSRPTPSIALSMTPRITPGTPSESPRRFRSSTRASTAASTAASEQASTTHVVDLSSSYPPQLNGDPSYFPASLKKLDDFASNPVRNASVSVTLENARLRLLHDALSCRDFIYLVIHQLYSLGSYALAELAQLQRFSEDQFAGLKILGQLLADNARLSPQFLLWASCFPEPIADMVRLPWWTAALSQAMTALAMLGHRWNAFEARILERGLPPLIEELIQNFALRSHVLHHTIFLALTRRIPGPNKREERLSEIFRHDAALTEVRLAEARRKSVPLSRARKETDAILTLYHVNMGYPPPHTPASVFAPQPVIASASPQAGRPIHSARTPGVLLLPTPPLADHSPQSTQASPVPAAPAPVLHTNTPSLKPTTAHMSVTIPSPSFAPAPTESPVQGPGRPRRPPAQAEAAQQAILTMRRTSRPGALPPTPTPTKPSKSPLLLPASATIMPANAPPLHPLRDALHQVHLRESVHQLVRRDSTGQSQETKLFQYLDSFALTPTPLGRFECQFHWSFTLSQEAADRLPAPSQMSSGEVSHPVRVLMDGQQLYRMRCISVSPDTKLPIDESTWSRAECAWPSVIYIFVNDTELFVRRKYHHQKDVPLDITPHLRVGENKISLHFIRDAAEQKDKLYAAAVEIAQIAALEPVMALAQTLDADDSCRQIHQRLEQSSSNDNEDDDLHVVSTDLVINLVDPFTARVFKQPVRGQLCLHSECFDHETFIQTRAAVSGPRALPNDWRCPICQRDARPQMLVRDEFMVDVHNELVRTNQLDDARAIRVTLDGSWTVVTEADLPAFKRSSTGLDSPIPKRPKMAPPETKFQPIRTASASPEVIDLD